VLPQQSVTNLFIPMVSVEPHRIPSMGREFSPCRQPRAAILNARHWGNGLRSGSLLVPAATDAIGLVQKELPVT
jgi:hypothetical protein